MAYMHGNKVEICGVNTSRLVTLGEAEKKELLLKARGGDAGARQRLIDGNLRLVLSVIRRFGNRGEDPDDLFQIGCIGLIKAVDNFNTGLDVRFSTYAVPISVRWGKIRDIKNLSVKKLRLSFLTDTCFLLPVRRLCYCRRLVSGLYLGHGQRVDRFAVEFKLEMEVGIVGDLDECALADCAELLTGVDGCAFFYPFGKAVRQEIGRAHV